MMKKGDFVAWYAKQFIGTLYKWGGDDPSGFDCSGLAIECLKSVGKLPRKYDTTAAGLQSRYRNQTVGEARPGCLVFWKNMAGRITHVEIAISRDLAIGASGGGSKTLTPSDAIRHNAFIKIRPIQSRSGVHSIVDPFK